MLCMSLLELYKNEFVRAGGTEQDINNHTAQAFMKKIKDKFGDRISISTYDHRKEIL